MKDLYIDQMNNDRNGPDDTDWDAPEYDLASFTKADTEPQPEAVQADGKNCGLFHLIKMEWIIKYGHILIKKLWNYFL